MPNGLLAIAGGLAGATLLVALHVPAGGIVGAVAGSAVVSGARAHPPPPRAVRLAGMVLLGCAAGVRLEAETLRTLLHLMGPLLLAIGLLLVADVLLALVLTRRYGVDPVTALLACAPGGISEISVIAQTTGARTGVVVSVHVIRVVTVVVLVLPLLLALLGHG